MHVLFTLARLFPYWALVVAFALIELGVFFKRRRKRGKQWGCWLVALLFVGLIVAWFYWRGDLHADKWIRAWFVD
jgi:hypothetical protein